MSDVQVTPPSWPSSSHAPTTELLLRSMLATNWKNYSIVTNFSSVLLESMENSSTTADMIVASDTRTMFAPSTSPTIGKWRHGAPWIVILSLAYLVVFILGLVGNASVLWVVFGLRRNACHSMFSNCNKVFNGLIANLAFADLLVIIFCLPATLVGNVLTPWILGRFVCKAVPYLQGVSVTASVYTLVVISIDRFYGIYYPFANGFSTLVRRLLIVFIWAFSLLIALPWAFVFDLEPYEDYLLCIEDWPNKTLENAYFLGVNLAIQYLLPLSIIIFFYILLFVKIWRRKFPMFHSSCQRETSTDTIDRWNARHVEASKMRVLKMLIIIVSLFALSWLPLYGVFIRVKFGGSIEDNSFEGSLVFILTPLAQWLGASNSCVNPILYFFFNAKFRAYLKKTIARSIMCSSSVEYSRNHLYYYNHNHTLTVGGAHSPGAALAKDNNSLNTVHFELAPKDLLDQENEIVVTSRGCNGRKRKPNLANGNVALNVLPIVIEPFMGKPKIDSSRNASESSSDNLTLSSHQSELEKTASKICKKCHENKMSVCKQKSAPPPATQNLEKNATKHGGKMNSTSNHELGGKENSENTNTETMLPINVPELHNLSKWPNSALEMITTAAFTSGRQSRETSV